MPPGHFDWEAVDAELQGISDGFKDPKFDPVSYVLNLLSSGDAEHELARVGLPRRVCIEYVACGVLAKARFLGLLITTHSYERMRRQWMCWWRAWRMLILPGSTARSGTTVASCSVLATLRSTWRPLGYL